MPDGTDPYLDRCTCFYLRRAARQATRLYDAELAPSGLTLTQYSLLSALARTAPICLHDLAHVLGADRTTLSRTVKPLSKEGLIELAHGADGRFVTIAMTAAGRDRLVRARPLWQAAQDEVRRRLGDAETAALNRRLDEDFHKLDAGGPASGPQRP